MQKRRIWVLIMVLMIAFTTFAAAETAPPEKLPLSVNGYELTYDDIMREGVSFYLPEDEFSVSENAVVFTKLVNETAYPLFTLYVYSDEGDIHTVIWSDEGDIVPVSFVYAPIPEDLSPEESQLFKLDAEEAVNMLIATLDLLQVPSGQPQAAQTVIALEDYSFSFTFRNSTRIQIKAEGNQAQFVLPLEDGTELIVYTLVCGSEEGSIVIPVTDDTGAKVMLAFTMPLPPEDLDEQTETSFYQAQETVNDVLSTIQLGGKSE